MTTKTWTVAIALALGVIATAGAAGAGPTEKADYLVISPHTAEGCLNALDHLVEAQNLDRFEFGCLHGDHTGYARVRATSASEALAIVPLTDRGAARAVELNRFTPQQIAAFHGAKK